MIEFLQTFPGQMIALSLIAFFIFLSTRHTKDLKKMSFHFSSQKKSSLLSTFTVDYTEKTKIGNSEPIIGRQNEIIRLAQILARKNKNNAILVGAPGVGKTAIVEALAARIVTKEVPDVLLHKKVLALDIASLFSNTKYRGEFEERAKKIVEEIATANRTVILFVDEIHSIIQSQGTEGAINFSDILKPALARGDLQMIGATTHEEYKRYIESDAALARRFQVIFIDEPNKKETIQILQGVKDTYRDYHQVEFTDAAIEAAVEISQKLIKGRTQPDKSLDALDEAASLVRVAHIHEHVPVLLYKSVVKRYPSLKKIWHDIQKLDKQILKAQKKHRDVLISKRETLEKRLQEKGMFIVDVSDIEKVIHEWI